MDDDDDEVDPEVKADIELRERTGRERPRRSVEAIYNWTPPEYVDRWPCRNRCGRVVAVTAEAVHALDVHNRKLKGCGQAELDITRIVFCDACRADGGRLSAQSNRKQVDAIAALVRELRGGTTHPKPPGPPPDPERERHILDALRRYYHPDVDGLVESLRRSRASQTPKRGA